MYHVKAIMKQLCLIVVSLFLHTQNNFHNTSLNHKLLTIFWVSVTWIKSFKCVFVTCLESFFVFVFLYYFIKGFLFFQLVHHFVFVFLWTHRFCTYENERNFMASLFIINLIVAAVPNHYLKVASGILI